MTKSLSWIYYRIFFKEPSNFTHFLALLNRVINPVVDEFADHIRHFHFLNYSGSYDMHLEGDEGVIERLNGVGDKEHIGFIRLRIQADPAQVSVIREKLLSLIQNSDILRGYEVPRTPFDPDRDLGTRFGQTRTKEVMDLLHASSRLALSFAKGDEVVNPSPQGQGGPGGLVHLVANTLRHQIMPGVIIASWGEGPRFAQTSEPLL